jgi:prevent-host-death family protein
MGARIEIDQDAASVYTESVHKENSMAKEKIMTFVEARSKLSEIVDRVAESGDTYVVSKRQKPRAVIIGIDRYRELSGTSKYMKNVGKKKIFKLGGIGTAVGDIDEAIRELRKSRIEAVTKKFS